MEGVPPYPTEDIKRYRKLHLWWDMTFGFALERIATIYSYRTIVVDDNKRITYAQLNDQVTRLALGLVEVGLRPGDIVLMQMPNTIEFCVAFMAFQRIGVVPVMGVPRHGLKEMVHFGTLARAAAWIGPSTFRKTNYLEMLPVLKEKVPSLKHVILVEDEGERTGMLSYNKIMTQVAEGRYSSESLGKYSPDPNEVALFLPTGGTTGLPKLAPRTHNNYLCNTYFNGVSVDKSPRDKDLVVTPIAHMAGLLRFVHRLIFGGTLILGNSTHPKDILETIQREKATTCFFVPALLMDILNEPERESYDLSSLFVIFSAGAFLAPETIREARRRFKFHVLNYFGMSEGPNMGPRLDYPEEEIIYTVGKPICLWDEFVVLDDQGKLLPQGQEGELAARGPSIFTGYYRAEDINRKVFTGDGFYITGDLARINDKGNFIITGRKKDLINRGGEKVSAEEVEDMILTMEGVREAAVVAMPDARLGEKVCAYIKAKEGFSFHLDGVTAHLKSLGASVLLLPERIEMIEEFPLTAIGKIDKKVLRERIAAKLAQETKN